VRKLEAAATNGARVELTGAEAAVVLDLVAALARQADR
jgi:hypothetical protein